MKPGCGCRMQRGRCATLHRRTTCDSLRSVAEYTPAMFGDGACIHEVCLKCPVDVSRLLALLASLVVGALRPRNAPEKHRR